MSDLKILAGLGNPGLRYAGNRHNIGFMVVERIADRYGFSPFTGKFQARAASGRIEGGRCLILQPTTFMNESGRSLASARHFYRLEPSAIHVFHDDIDLEPGDVRVKIGGSHGGHNGLRSIDAHIGREYHRIRIGIGRPKGHRDVNPHVMGDFSSSEKPAVRSLVDDIAAAIPCLLAGDKAAFLLRLHGVGS